MLRRYRPPTVFPCSRARDHSGRGRDRGRAGSGSGDGGGRGGGVGGGGSSRGWRVLLLAARFVSTGSGGGRAAHFGRNKPSNCGHRADRSPKPRRGPPVGLKTTTSVFLEPLFLKRTGSGLALAPQETANVPKCINFPKEKPQRSAGQLGAPSQVLRPQQPFPLLPRTNRAWFLLSSPHPPLPGTLI